VPSRGWRVGAGALLAGRAPRSVMGLILAVFRPGVCRGREKPVGTPRLRSASSLWPRWSPCRASNAAGASAHALCGASVED
jgi:hypothetical protein